MPLSAITAAARHEGLFCSPAALDQTAGDTTDTYFLHFVSVFCHSDCLFRGHEGYTTRHEGTTIRRHL